MPIKKWTEEENANLLKWRTVGPNYKTFEEIAKLLRRKMKLVHRHHQVLTTRNYKEAPKDRLYHHHCLLCRKEFDTLDIGDYYCCASHRVQNVTNNSYLSGTGSSGYAKSARIGA